MKSSLPALFVVAVDPCHGFPHDAEMTNGLFPAISLTCMILAFAHYYFLWPVA